MAGCNQRTRWRSTEADASRPGQYNDGRVSKRAHGIETGRQQQGRPYGVSIDRRTAREGLIQ